jgi:cytochrome P450
MTGDDNAGLSLNHLFRPDFVADPYPFYHRLRTKDPVHWDQHRNAWVLSRYADVVAVLNDARFTTARWGPDADSISNWRWAELGPSYGSPPEFLLFTDGPIHARMRALVARALVAHSGSSMRVRIQHCVDRLLGAIREPGDVDLFAALARLLPFHVMADTLGIPAEDWDRVLGWSDDHANLINMRSDKLQAGYEGHHQLREYFRHLIASRRESPSLVDTLVAMEETDSMQCSVELLSNMALLLTAGHATTTNLIANGLLALLKNTDQLQTLRADPGLMASAVEELLRYDSPIQITSRVATESAVIAGRAVERGQTVFVLLGAANRDPVQFVDPDRLDLNRRDNRHVAFSFGSHHCLGASLARLEAQLALATVLRRYPNLRLSTARLEWDRNPTVRSLKSLPVVV